MLASSGLAIALRPTQRIAEQGPAIDLERMVPLRFAEWKLDTNIVPIAASPDVQEKLDAIYEQTLSRTYVNQSGDHIMLSIAYGGDQSSDRSQVHRPEFCYGAQGFQLKNKFENTLNLSDGRLNVRRLEAVQGGRNEPITYWITVGDSATLPGIGRKLMQIRYGVTGKIPDGMLVRVSSIDQNANRAYQIQDQFIRDLHQSLAPQDQVRVVGRVVD